MWSFTLLIVKLNSSDMRILLKQEQRDIFKEIQSALKSKNTDLSKYCRNNGIDYQKTYKKLNASMIDYEWLSDLYSDMLPGEELILNITK
jgi:hypothetical protein